MGITQRLGTIPLAIQTDASNNVGIGAAPSGSYKLEVTGTGRFTGALTIQGDNSIYSGGTANNFNTYPLAISNTKNLVFGSPSAAQPTRMWSGGIGADASENIFLGAYNNLSFGAGNLATRMTILGSNGNVGIGNTNPFAGATALTGLAISDRGGLFKLAVNDVVYTSNNLYYDGANWKRIVAAGGTLMQLESSDGGSFSILSTATGSAGSNATLTERMRITSGGVLRLLSQATYASMTYEQTIQYATSPAGIWFGNSFNSNNNVALQLRTSNDGTGVQAMTLLPNGNTFFGTTLGINANINYEFRASNSNGGVAILSAYNTSTFASSPSISCYKGSTDTSSNNRFIQFYCSGESQPMGGIVGNGAANAQFATISDIREKENIIPISGSLNKILALNPVEFDWLKTGEHIKAGFVAQQVEEVFPEYVVENMSNDGEEERKGLTGGLSSGIIAHLVKAMQELNERLNKAGL
jgi:hypothetical protein